MSFAHRDDVVYALASDGAYEPLCKPVAPGAGLGRDHVLQTQCGHLVPEDLTVDPVAISNQVRDLRGVIVTESFDELLRGPLSGWVGGDVDVQDPSGPVVQDDEHEQAS
jgi:hypothetical protein